MNEPYDWRKGKKLLQYDYARDNWMGIWGGEHLEPTQGEITWWRGVFHELRDLRDESAQSYGYLKHPKFGKLICLTSLKLRDLLERERWWSIQTFKGTGIVNLLDDRDADVLNRFAQVNALVRNVATRTLEGDVPSPLELKNNKIEYVCRGNSTRESHDSVVWHSMIQNNQDLQALPYIGMIPEEEAKRAIDTYFEEKREWLLKNATKRGR